MEKMEEDSNHVASRCQIHNHTFTCFKYGQRKSAQGGDERKSSSVTPSEGYSPPSSLKKPTNELSAGSTTRVSLPLFIPQATLSVG
jgi:hypothetical protein